MTIIWSEEAGDPDTPLIALVHGSMDRSTGMLKLSRRLDDRFRVLRYDRRGYNRSGTPSADYSIGAQVADLIELLAGRRALVIGHSYGGNVALAAAATHPDLVAGVAVYESPMSWEPSWPGRAAGVVAEDRDPGESAERFMRMMLGDSLWESLPERTRMARRGEGATFVGELRQLASGPPWVAADIRCPLVVAYGTLAREHHRVAMRRLHEQVPGSELVVLDGCRHDAPLSHSALFASAIVEPLAHKVGPPWSAALGPASSPPRP
ncbi:MAG TPA: alpha/beta hydrolase [Ilumatobacteraceae bacterium]